jgi:hypothetical protein
MDLVLSFCPSFVQQGFLSLVKHTTHGGANLKNTAIDCAKILIFL